MNDTLIYGIGFLAQGLFAGRLIVQWIKSENAKKSLSPTLFWQLSILASWLLFLYGLLRNDFAIILGQVITYFIYIRNLQLKGNWKKLPLLSRVFCLLSPIIAFTYMAINYESKILLLFYNQDIPFWLLIWGSLGQLIFTFRFIYQWIYSEREGESILPLGFWVISLIGAIMILSYAVYRKDPVLLMGQGLGTIIYIRNIILIKKSKILS
ncbi:lauroyl acyltransferase [Labilibaculum sp. A4]|uniref:lipid-A-disaccharide synthase N-terminal domain-containing protein n=1 Tax=Labilibaculum euxinus TaxID=2686357 RepID=UPI000F61AFB6|nr:lipid-A-disaccharide synthase N-terminal domain-containing protein [Labilibaculum euxinus]MDQ1769322.1 lipid-A-disaccharide synthase N-terminal domain-containing protein [Labilibaculum euxinus]MWN74847.1 lauroyl acyltransferase [Labilibaculum euxinus]